MESSNSGASATFAGFRAATELPVTPTLMGLVFSVAHPLSLGMLGMHGTFAANMAVAKAILLIAIGVRFDDRVTGKLATLLRAQKLSTSTSIRKRREKNRAPIFL
jgi:acetolactate synthase-1/2/3 large subunit